MNCTKLPVWLSHKENHKFLCNTENIAQHSLCLIWKQLADLIEETTLKTETTTLCHCCQHLSRLFYIKLVHLFGELLDIFFLIKINTKWKSKTNLYRYSENPAGEKLNSRQQSSIPCRFHRILYSHNVWLKHDSVKLLFVYNAKTHTYTSTQTGGTLITKSHAGCLSASSNYCVFITEQNPYHEIKKKPSVNKYKTYSHTPKTYEYFLNEKNFISLCVQHNKISWNNIFYP